MARLRSILIRRPWWHSPALWIAIFVFAALAGALLAANFTAGAEPAVSQRPSFQRETNQPAVQPVQPAPEVTAPVIKEWPKTQVQWQRVAQPAGVTPFTKIDDGFYAGTSQNSQAGSEPTPEGTAFAKRILPQLEGATAILVGAARDPVDKSVVLVSIMAGDKKIVGLGYLLISVDGETSWHRLNLPPEVNPRTGASAVRVTADRENIYPVVRDSNVAEEWYGTIIKRSGLYSP
jgi:hypothetical protein